MSYPYKIIDSEAVYHQLSRSHCIDLMRSVFSALESGESIQPLRTILRISSQKLLGLMPAYDAIQDIMGVKVIGVFPDNRKKGLGSHQGVILLFECETGKLIASVDAESITAIRTAAVSAVATDMLAREDSSTLAILGAGTQAREHIKSISLIRDIKNIFVWNRTYHNAVELCEELGNSFNVEPFAQMSCATTEADIICTVTASPEPILDYRNVKKGVHINAVGACTPRARELSSALVAASVMFTDSIESLTHESGDYLIPLQEEKIDESHIRGTLSQLINGDCQGRNNKSDITLFNSLGLAIEDITSAAFVYGGKPTYD